MFPLPGTPRVPRTWKNPVLTACAEDITDKVDAGKMTPEEAEPGVSSELKKIEAYESPRAPNHLAR